VRKGTLLMALRVSVLSIIIFMMLYGRPPAIAQSSDRQQAVIDAVQDEKIRQNSDEIDRHEKSDDTRVLSHDVRLQAIESRVATIEGWGKGIGGMLVLQVLTIIFQVKGSFSGRGKGKKTQTEEEGD
jgi:hypothetical protein